MKALPFRGNQYRRMPRLDRFWAHVVKGEGCWDWNGKRTPAGYGIFYDDDGEHRYAHRLSFELTNGPLDDGEEALHSCDQPPCIRPVHLFKGTQADNVDDMIRKGRAGDPRLGLYEIDGRAKKLDAIERALVAEAILAGRPQKEIAGEYGISQAAVSYHAVRMARGRAAA